MRSNSIAKALRHGQLSIWRNTKEERTKFADSVHRLDAKVAECMKERGIEVRT
jgi:hypothetical protein